MAEKNSLWKNIRNKAKQNRKTGATPKKPTAEMLRQERKIKSQKAEGGTIDPFDAGPGKRPPIYTSDPNDPRLQAYNDSLGLYNSRNLYNQEAENILRTSRTDREYSQRMGFRVGNIPSYPGVLGRATNETNRIWRKHPNWNPISNVDPGYVMMPDGVKRRLENVVNFQKPVQPVIYEKPRLKHTDINRLKFRLSFDSPEDMNIVGSPKELPPIADIKEFNPSKVLIREMGNLDKNRPDGERKLPEVYMDDGLGWRPVKNFNEYEMYKEQYPGSNTTKGWIKQKAEGGIIGEDDNLLYRQPSIPMEEYQPELFDSSSISLRRSGSNKVNLHTPEYRKEISKRLNFNPYLNVITPTPNTYVYSGGVDADLNLLNKNNNRLSLTGGLGTGIVKHPGGSEYIGVEPSVGLSFTRKFNNGGAIDPPDGSPLGKKYKAERSTTATKNMPALGTKPYRLKPGDDPGKDTIADDLFELIDPTGLTSWDDALADDADFLDKLSVIPLTGKVGTVMKMMKSPKTGLSMWHLATGAGAKDLFERVDPPKTNKAYGGNMYAEGGTMDPPDGVTKPNQATRADSIAVLNSALATKNYYNNPKNNYSLQKTNPITSSAVSALNSFYAPTNEASKKVFIPETRANLQKYIKSPDIFFERYPFWIKSNNIKTENDVRSLGLKASALLKNKTPNRFPVWDAVTGAIDFASPPVMYDTRIKPQGIFSASNVNSPGGDVEIPYYDPLAVAPWDTLNESQRKERIEKYGTTGTPVTKTTTPPADTRKLRPSIDKLQSKRYTSDFDNIDIVGSPQQLPPTASMDITPEGHYRVARVSPHADPYYQVWENKGDKGSKWVDMSPEQFDKISQEKYLTEYKKYGGTMSNNKKNYLKYAKGGTFGDDKKRAEVLNSPANEGSFVFKPATDWATNWVNDPEYAARLNQNFPDRSKITKLDTVFQSKKDAREDKREKNLEGFSNYVPKLVADIGDTRFLYNSDPAANEKLYGNYSSMYNEEDVAEVKKELKKNPQAFTDPYGNTIIRNRSNDPGQAGAMSAANHEIWHQLEIPGEKTDAFGNRTYETLDRAYDGKFATPDPSTWPLDEKGQPKMPSKKEFYPMLMQLRMDNNFQPGEEIDDARLDQIRKAGSSNPLLKFYNNEKLKTYLNTFASNQGTPSQDMGVQRAAYGGTIKMNNGGTPSFGSTLPADWSGDYFNTQGATDQYNQQALQNGTYDFSSGAGPLAPPPGSAPPQPAPPAQASTWAPNSGMPKEASGMVYKGLDMIAPGIGTAAKIGDQFTDMAAGLGQDLASRKFGYRNQEEKDIAFKYSNKLDSIPVLGTQIGMGIDAFRGMSGSVQKQIAERRLDNQISNSSNYLGNAKSYVMSQGGALPFNEYKGLTHDQVNPNTGQTGISLPKSNPNAPTIEVEDGEVSLGSNVYSNRLFLNGKKGITFAQQAKKDHAAAEFRPNDKITKQTTQMKLDKLFKMQEMQKAAAQDRYDIMKADMMSSPEAQKIMAKYGGRIKMSNAGGIPDLEAVTPENIMSMSGINEGALNLAQMGQMVSPAMQVFQAARDKDELKFDRVDVPRLDTFTPAQIMKQQSKEQVASASAGLQRNAANQGQYVASKALLGATAASNLGRNIALMSSDLRNKQAFMDFEGNKLNTELENKQREYAQARRDFLRKQKLEGVNAGFARGAGVAKDDAAFKADLFSEAIKANAIGGEEYMLGYNPDTGKLEYQRRKA